MRENQLCDYVTNRRGVPLFHQFASGDESRPLVIFCNPLLEEALFCRNHLTGWFLHLAKKNYNVLTFDYQGSGNSGGEHPVSANRMLEDLIDLASRYWRKHHAEQQLFLIGIRFGFNIALKATELLHADKLIGVEPIIDLDRYRTALFRTNLITQLSTSGKIVTDRKQLMAELEAGNRISLSGHGIDLEFIRSLGDFDLRNVTGMETGRVKIFLRASGKISFGKKRKNPLRKSGFACTSIEMEPFWAETKYYSPAHSILYCQADRFLDP